MKKNLLAAAFMLLSSYIFAQVNSCQCPENLDAGTTEGDAPQKVFTFKNGRQIILCGYENEEDGKAVYSEFILQECDSPDIIGFWEAMFTGTVEFKNNVIFIKEEMQLPVGPNRSFVATTWSTETIQYLDKSLVRKRVINRSIRKYTEAEIKATLQEFEEGSAKYKGDVEDLMGKLFIAALSGSTKAKTYFDDFDRFATLDGAVAEQYKDLSAMLSEFIRN
ncbi:hypothetical protein ACLI1A_12080 [Flavobacterium sp. RHBU_3]|uniref:hypothetical protein n=1 Tax=Flavobacterium sp. RHBU_3 TaxID=3391184 RepID=UPI0039855FC3